jgi:hypothetical protein
VGGSSGVEEPLSWLWSSLRHAGSSQSSKQGLIVPNIGGRWLVLNDTGRRLGWSTGEVGVLWWSTGARTKDTGTWNSEGHLPGLDHPGPWIHARRPGRRRARRSVGAGAARVVGTATTTAPPTTTPIVMSRGRGLANRLGTCSGLLRARAGAAVAGGRLRVRRRTTAAGGDQSLMSNGLGLFLVIVLL